LKINYYLLYPPDGLGISSWTFVLSALDSKFVDMLLWYFQSILQALNFLLQATQASNPNNI